MKPLKTLAIFMSLLIVMLPLTLAEEFSRTYDLNGNLISDGKYYREYDGLNQLVKVRLGNTSTSPILEEYVWHPIEERTVIKRVFYNGVYNYTVYYPSKEYIRIVNSSGTFDEVYVKDGENILAQVDADGNKIAVHNDHIGSVSLLTDVNGEVLEETFYSPYGEILEGGTASRFDYEGKEFDSVVDDYDFNFRKYDPAVPLFNQPDTLIQNVFDPQLLNRYSFERNNPYRYTDPDGHYVILGALVVGTLFAGYEVIRQINQEGKSIFSGTINWNRVGGQFAEGATFGVLGETGTLAGLSKTGKLLLGLGLGIISEAPKVGEEEEEADESKVKTLEVYEIYHNQGPQTLSQMYQEGSALISNTFTNLGNSFKSFVRYVSSITGNTLDWYGKPQEKPKGEEYEKGGESSGGGGGGGWQYVPPGQGGDGDYYCFGSWCP